MTTDEAELSDNCILVCLAEDCSHYYCEQGSKCHGLCLQLVGYNCHGRPRTVWNVVVLFDIHKL